MSESNTLQHELDASLLLTQTADLVALVVLAIGKQFRGEEQNSLILTCLREWSAASKQFLLVGGYPAAQRQVTKAAVSAFLEAQVKSPSLISLDNQRQQAINAEASQRMDQVTPARGVPSASRGVAVPPRVNVSPTPPQDYFDVAADGARQFQAQHTKEPR